MELGLAIALIVGAFVLSGIVFFVVGMLYRKKVAEKEIGGAEEEARRILNEAIKSAESKKREMLLEAKEEIHKSRTEYEREVKERRADLQKQERRLQQKEESFDKKLDAHEKKEEELQRRLNKAAATQEEVEELIHLLGLEDHLNKRVDQLSGGQKQRVALARTMVMKPRILLLDEPLSALDGVIKESIKDRIKTIAREYHLTTIIVTHDPEEALTLSDRVLIIDQGTIAQYGRPAEIIQKPENDFVRKFILNQLEIKRNNIYALFGSSANSIAG